MDEWIEQEGEGLRVDSVYSFERIWGMAFDDCFSLFSFYSMSC